MAAFQWKAAPLERYIDDLPHKAERLAQRQAEFLARRTSERIVQVGAVRTGELRDSPTVFPYGSMARRVIVMAGHGGYVNYGTYRMAARPFWEPAIEDTRAEFTNAGREELKP